MISVIFKTPFRLCVFLFRYSILVFLLGFNCAIFFLGLSLQGKDRAGNGGKAHLGDVPGGYAQSVQRLRGVKVRHIPEIHVLKISRRINAAAHQQHIPNAVLHRPSVFHLQVQLVQFFQKAAFREGFQFRKIVGHIILHGVLCHREQGFAQILLMLQLPKAVFQRFNDVRRVFLPHRPKGDGPGEPSFMGIGNVKVVFQPELAIVLPIKNGNAVCAPVYPAPKLPVPSLDLQDGGGVWALGVDKQLFIERKPVVAAGRS
ncbi:MAG: hypothetical protein ACLU8C_07165 [Lacrimispora saccharolytica]